MHRFCNYSVSSVTGDLMFDLRVCDSAGRQKGALQVSPSKRISFRAEGLVSFRINLTCSIMQAIRIGKYQVPVRSDKGLRISNSIGIELLMGVFSRLVIPLPILWLLHDHGNLSATVSQTACAPGMLVLA